MPIWKKIKSEMITNNRIINLNLALSKPKDFLSVTDSG